MSDSSSQPKHNSLISSLFEKSDDIPTNWNIVRLSDLSEKKNDIVAGPFGSNLKVSDYVDEGIPIIRLQNIKRNHFIDKNIKFISKEKADELSYHSYQPNDLILAKLGDPIGETCKIPSNFPAGIVVADVVRIRPSSKKAILDFVEYILNSKICEKQLNREVIGTTRPRVNLEQIRNLEFLCPPKPEQQKIASILSNVDSLIDKYADSIETTEKLKKGLLQQFFTKGIGHKKFKKIDLGKSLLSMEIPVEWDLKPIDEVLSIVSNPIKLDDEKQYTRITVKRRNGGIVLRDIEYGKNIKVDKQHAIRSGDFIISNKQIIHNACGIIPEEFDGSIVSIEYTMLRGSNLLDMKFMNLFSYTDIFKKMIILTTQGVHIEKYVFLVNEWLKLKIPLPPINEQKKIIEIIENCELKISQDVKHKSQLEILKKGLMQKLLTGQIRVKT